MLNASLSIILERIVLFVIAPIVSVLIMTGQITAACRTDVTQAYSFEVGALLFIFSIGLGAIHSFFHAKNALNPQPLPPGLKAPQAPVTPQAPMTP